MVNIFLEIFHLGAFLRGGYLGVEFFFIVSGYYIGEKAETGMEFADFLKLRLKRLYPHYAISLTAGMLVRGISDIGDFLDKMQNLFWSLLMLQNMGLNLILYNGPLWYITHLIYGGGLIYFLSKKFDTKKKYFVFLFFVLIFYFTYIFAFNTLDNQNCILVVHLSFYRALVGMILGVLIYKVINDNIFSLKKCDFFVKIVIFALTICGLLISFLKPHTSFDLLVVLCFVVCICLSNTLRNQERESSFRKIIIYFGRKTYPLYCYQLLAFWIIEKAGRSVNMFGVIIVCMAMALFFDCFCKLGFKILQNHKHNCGRSVNGGQQD